MFIFVTYKDAPELSNMRRRSSDLDTAVEKTLLVNPVCHIRVMLEYIRKKCKLGIYSKYDLCDETGALKGLFNLPTYAYVADQFEHKKTYYLIVLRTGVMIQKNIPPMGRYNMLVDKEFPKFTYVKTVEHSIMEADKRISVLPQLNRENKFYPDLKAKIKRFMLGGETSPQLTGTSGKVTPPSKASAISPGKITPPKKKK